MSHLTGPNSPSALRVLVIAAALLLVPVTLSPAGVVPTVACSAEGPDDNCIFQLRSMCYLDGEFFNNATKKID